MQYHRGHSTRKLPEARAELLPRGQRARRRGRPARRRRSPVSPSPFHRRRATRTPSGRSRSTAGGGPTYRGHSTRKLPEARAELLPRGRLARRRGRPARRHLSPVFPLPPSHRRRATRAQSGRSRSTAGGGLFYRGHSTRKLPEARAEPLPRGQRARRRGRPARRRRSPVFSSPFRRRRATRTPSGRSRSAAGGGPYHRGHSTRKLPEAQAELLPRGRRARRRGRPARRRRPPRVPFPVPPQERDSDAVRSEPFHCGRGAAPPLALDSETARGPSRDAPRGQRARRRGRPARRRRSPALPPFFPRPTAGARPGRRPVGAVPLRAGSLPTAGTRLGSVALNKSTYSRGGREVVTAGVPGLGRSGPLLGRTRGAYI